MLELKIDPEFRDKIPPLSKQEFDLLEKNILEEKQIKEPIIVWNGTIIDGHHRWQIYQNHKDIIPEPKIEEKEFSDKWEASVYMFKNQLGRRNLTDEQRDYTIGKLYEAEKHTHGGDRGNQYTKVASDQNDHLAKYEKISKKIGDEYGVAQATVRRNEMFAKSVDKAEEVVPGFKEKVLSGNVIATKDEIRHLKQLDNDELKEKASEIVERNEKPKRVVDDAKKEERRKYKEDMAEIRRIIEEEAIIDNVVRTGMDAFEHIVSVLGVAKGWIDSEYEQEGHLMNGYIADKVIEEANNFFEYVKEKANEYR